MYSAARRGVGTSHVFFIGEREPEADPFYLANLDLIRKGVGSDRAGWAGWRAIATGAVRGGPERTSFPC